MNPARSAAMTPSLPADLGVALAWHDTVCPEAGRCGSRELHARSIPLYTTGVLHQFLDNLHTHALDPDDENVGHFLHAERCCAVHNTHVMPHRGCILR